MDMQTVVVKISSPKLVYYADFSAPPAHLGQVIDEAIRFTKCVGNAFPNLSAEVVDLSDPCPSSLHFERLYELVRLVGEDVDE